MWLMTPLPVLLYGIPPAVAIGTDLLYATITSAAGAVVHGLKNAVDGRVVGWPAPGSVPTSAMTLTCLSAYQPATKDADSILELALGVMLLATALALLYHKPLQAWAAVMVQLPGILLRRPPVRWRPPPSERQSAPQFDCLRSVPVEPELPRCCCYIRA